MQLRSITLLLAVAGVSACEPDDDVRVLPLPSLERASPEARLGLPEVAGSWRFAGWEIVRGDTTELERTFPSFGELVLSTQRLDSIGGTFALGGGATRVVGEVRRNGEVALVTLGDGAADRFIAGRYAQDTLWLELTSVLAADEWPQDARAAFVRDPVEEPIAWLRGARPGDVEAPPPADSMSLTPAPQPDTQTGPPGADPQQPGTQAPGAVTPSRPDAQPQGQPQPQPDRPAPSQPGTPPQGQPQPAAPSPPPPPPPPPPATAAAAA